MLVLGGASGAVGLGVWGCGSNPGDLLVRSLLVGYGDKLLLLFDVGRGL